MTRPTGRRPGRPPNIEQRIRLLCRDAAPQAAEALVRAAKLGDSQAQALVVRLALDLDAGRDDR
jgi:hypothetical protein